MPKGENEKDGGPQQVDQDIQIDIKSDKEQEQGENGEITVQPQDIKVDINDKKQKEKEKKHKKTKNEYSDDKDMQPCMICFTDYDQNKRKPPLKCGHGFCVDCYSNYILEKMNQNDVVDMKCPYEGCELMFDDDFIEEILWGEEQYRYRYLKRIGLLNKNPDLRWCCRTGCEKYVIGPSKTPDHKLTCECGQEICFECGNEFHPDVTCEQMIQGANDAYEKDEVKICPKCKRRTEKAQGCNHITCPMCKYQWCWLCHGKYSENHYSIFNPFGCPGLQLGK